MADKTTKTTVAVVAKPEGFAKLRDETGRLNENMRKGTREASRGFRESTKEVEGFTKALEKAIRAFGDTAQAKKLKEQIGDLNKEVSALRRNLDEAGRSKGAFLQGLAQGTGLGGEFVQRGPGMARQVAGRQLGKAAAAPGRMVGGGMFGGVSGLIGSMRELPLGLGMAAVPLGHAMGMAEKAVGMQQATLQAAPFLGGNLSRQFLRQGPNLERARQAAQASQALPVSREDIVGRMKRFPGEYGQAQGVSTTGGIQIWDEATADQASADVMMTRAEAAYKRSIRKQRRSRMREGRRRMMSGVAAAGLQMGGMGMQESLGFAAGLRETAGGVGAIGGGDLRTAIGAQTAYGVGQDVSGQFLRAGRRGGAVGAEGRGMDSMTDAMSRGLQLGLEGSELVDFMRQMAQGIQSFQQTGIPLNTDSISDIGQVFRAAGVQGGRLGVVAGAVQQFGRGVAARGPQGALDLMMLKAAGFKGGGMENMLQAMTGLEKGIGGPEFSQILERLVAAGGGGAGSTFVVQRALQQMGANVSLTRAGEIVQKVQSGTLSEEGIKEFQAARGGKGVTAGGIQNVAKQLVTTLAPAMKETAAINNRQIAVGEGMIVAVKSLESAMTSTAAAVKNLGADEIKTLAKGVETIAGYLEGLSEDVGKEGGLTSLVQTQAMSLFDRIRQ